MKKAIVILILYTFLFSNCSREKIQFDNIEEKTLQKYLGEEVKVFLEDVTEEYTSYIFTTEQPGKIKGCRFTYKNNFIEINIVRESYELDKVFKIMKPWTWSIDDFTKLKIKDIHITKRFVNKMIDNELISSWIKLQFTERESDDFYNLIWSDADLDFTVKNDPDIAWLIILKIIERNKSNTILEQLSSGHFKNFIIYHGKNYIELIEKQAREDHDFAILLGGLLDGETFKMVDDTIWERIKSVWNLKGWGGIPIHRLGVANTLKKHH